MTTDAGGPAELDEPGLDELSQARLAEGRALLANLMAEDARLAGAMGAERDYSKPDWDAGPAHEAYYAWDEGTWLTPLSVEQRRCVLFAASELQARGGHPYSRPHRWLGQLAELPLGLAVGDVRLLAALSEPGQDDGGYEPFEHVLDFLEQLLATGALGATSLADAIADQVQQWNPMAHHWHGADWVLRASDEDREEHVSDVADLRTRALALAGRPPAPPALEGFVSRDDGWGLAAIARLGVIEDWPSGVVALIEHCALAKATRPGSRWNKVCRQRLEAIAEPADLLKDLLELVVTTEPVNFLTRQGRRAFLVGFNEQLIKGLVWAAGVLDPPWLPQVLQAVAVRCLRLCSGHVFRATAVQGEKIPNACFHALAESGSDASLIALARIGRATTNGSVLNHLARILQEVSAERGLSPDSLLDHLTPDHGLDAETGQLSIQTETGLWTIRLDDRHGAVAQGPPDTDAPQEVIDATAEIKATVSTVRDRLDGLLSNYREWHVTDFADGYVRHPLVGWLARRLVWTYTTPNGDTVHGFPDAAGAEVTTPQGSFQVPVDGLVRLTHPVLLTGTEVGQLRRLGQELAITQPVRQLWRETYQVSADEQRQGLFSERYAGHILRFSHGYGLARRRGWTGGFLSAAWDGGDTAVAKRDYPSAGLRASWALSDVDGIPGEVAVGLCKTDRLSFSPLGDAYGAPVPLADVPADVFSEAMRDLDLVVSVTTVANDPAWFTDNRFHPGIDEYWKRIAEGGFVQFRSHRREVIAEFFDGLTSEKYELTDAELIVRGALATYRIDLATANVRMEPGGKYLSFDTKLSRQAQYDHDVWWLPAFDDDEILRRILIRAAILADDEHLASRKLLKQIRG
ncbi:MAG TPA: DUF4132 domain-containing protein [Streptosporangiaceae bacterium]|nr:DUF4132 domain-containing protein [Streptosporangiaceae bacterium]